MISESERRVLHDALAEFVEARVGFADDDVRLLARAVAYVEKRYREQSAKWRARKVQDVINRCAHARKLLDDVRTGRL